MKTIITIEDTPRGTVKFKMEFDPPLSKTEPLTNAQETGMFLMDCLKGVGPHGPIKVTGNDEDGEEVSETFDEEEE